MYSEMYDSYAAMLLPSFLLSVMVSAQPVQSATNDERLTDAVELVQTTWLPLHPRDLQASMPLLDTFNLTSEHRDTFEKLQAITASPGQNKSDDDIHHELAILESVGWDIERAVDAIYSGSKRTIEPMSVDDSAQNSNTSPHERGRSTLSVLPVRIFFSLLSLATYPVTLTFGIISHVFRFLRIPLPRAPIGFSLASFSLTHSRGLFTNISAARGPRLPDNPTFAAERLIRDLEEETNAMVISRARAIQAESTPLAGPSHVQDMVFVEPSRKLLPDFHVGSYDSALQLARQEARPLCAILLSEEHDDTPVFKRTVLSDSGFVRALYDGEFVVWIGEIRNSDAYQASLKLSATTFPFVAFIALQPRLPISRSQTGLPPTALTVLSRHPSTAMPIPLTPLALIEHITTTIMPRVRPLRLQVLAREEERRLREQQDAAFRSAERADGERIRRRRREEAEAQERARLQEEARQRAAEEQKRKEEKHRLYKRWLSCKLTLLRDEPARGIRIGVRLPNGRLGIRKFHETSNVEDLYIWAGSMLYNVVPIHEKESEFDNYAPEYDFSLATTFPRCQIPLVKDQLLADVDVLKAGANLIVEGFRDPESADAGSSDEEDDDRD